jgi:transcriptional regulator with XRE-family HTH domain
MHSLIREFLSLATSLPRGRRALVVENIALRHQSQIHRNESGASQPTLDTLRKLARALSITTDELVFEEDERGPDDALRLQFEAVSRFNPDEKKTAKDVLDGLILKHEARRWTSSG